MRTKIGRTFGVVLVLPMRRNTSRVKLGFSLVHHQSMFTRHSFFFQNKNECDTAFSLLSRLNFWRAYSSPDKRVRWVSDKSLHSSLCATFQRDLIRHKEPSDQEQLPSTQLSRTTPAIFSRLLCTCKSLHPIVFYSPLLIVVQVC